MYNPIVAGLYKRYENHWTQLGWTSNYICLEHLKQSYPFLSQFQGQVSPHVTRDSWTMTFHTPGNVQVDPQVAWGQRLLPASNLCTCDMGIVTTVARRFELGRFGSDIMGKQNVVRSDEKEHQEIERHLWWWGWKVRRHPVPRRPWFVAHATGGASVLSEDSSEDEVQKVLHSLPSWPPSVSYLFSRFFLLWMVWKRSIPWISMDKAVLTIFLHFQIRFWDLCMIYDR